MLLGPVISTSSPDFQALTTCLLHLRVLAASLFKVIREIATMAALTAREASFGSARVLPIGEPPPRGVSPSASFASIFARPRSWCCYRIQAPWAPCSPSAKQSSGASTGGLQDSYLQHRSSAVHNSLLSFAAKRAMARPARGSAHHQPKRAFVTSPTRRKAER